MTENPKRTIQPLVSVIMPVHNGGAFLDDAVESILGQSLVDLELIVIDDASTDNTAKLLKRVSDPRVTILTNEKQCGVAESLNRGLEVCRGDLIARMDADDISLPDRLERQVAHMNDNPDVVLCGTEALRIDEQGKRLRSIKRLHTDVEIKWHLLSANPFIHPSVVYRSTSVRRVGGYDPDLRCAQDYDLWCRLSREGRCSNLPETLLLYRYHPRAISAQKRSVQLQVTRRRSKQFLIESGLANSESEAAIFLAFSDQCGEESKIADYSVRQWKTYPEIVERFFDQFDTSHDGIENAITCCRRRIRRKLLEKVRRSGLRIDHTIRLLRIAKCIDPSGTRIPSLMSTAIHRVIRRITRAAFNKPPPDLTANSFAVHRPPSAEKPNHD